MIDESLTVIAPAYKEEDSIQETLKRLLAHLEQIASKFEVILVVDGSPDETANRARDLNLPNLRVIEYFPNRGKGFAIKSGVQSIREETDLVCFMDADLDLHPASIGVLIELMIFDKLDVIVGSKIHLNSIVNYPLFRRVQSRIFQLICRMLFSLSVRDTQTGLKIFRRQVLDQCISDVETNGFAFDLELLIVATERNFKIGEGPIELDYQFSSTTGLSAVRTMFAEVVRIKRKRNRNSTT